MILTNATITEYATVVGQRGDGKPVVQALDLTTPIHAEVGAPRWTHRQTLQAKGIERGRLLTVEPGQFLAEGIDPAKVGDRLSVSVSGRTAELYAVIEVIDDVSQIPGAIDTVQLLIAPAVASSAQVLPAV